MNGIWKAFLLGVLVVGLGGILAGTMLWNKGPLQVEDMKPSVSYTSEEFLQQFLSGKEAEVTARLNNQLIEVKGNATYNKSQKSINFKTASGEIICTLSDGQGAVLDENNQIAVKVKGSFVGYESLIDPTISMSNCVISK